MSKKEAAKRYVFAIIGVFFGGIGVAFTKQGEIGVSQLSSVANVLSIRFEFLSLGYWLLIWNLALILLQVVILRRKFQPYQLLQIPLSLAFGLFTDFGVYISNGIPVDTYAMKLVMLFVGMLIMCFGIAISVVADVIMNAGEAAVKAIADTSHKAFGNIKVIFDICCVAMAVVLSLVLCHGIEGVREGTIITAVFSGFIIKFFQKHMEKPFEKFFKA